MFNKWKTKQELCKAYKIYHEKAISFLYSNLYTHEEYKQLQDIQYAIAYVLCEYFDFNYEFYYDFPFSNKWGIAYDYIYYYNECEEAYKKIIKQNNTTEYNYATWSINNSKDNYSKGDIVYNMENGCLYIHDGKKFINMC